MKHDLTEDVNGLPFDDDLIEGDIVFTETHRPYLFRHELRDPVLRLQGLPCYARRLHLQRWVEDGGQVDRPGDILVGRDQLTELVLQDLFLLDDSLAILNACVQLAFEFRDRKVFLAFFVCQQVVGSERSEADLTA